MQFKNKGSDMPLDLKTERELRRAIQLIRKGFLIKSARKKFRNDKSRNLLRYTLRRVCMLNYLQNVAVNINTNTESLKYLCDVVNNAFGRGRD